MTRGRCGSLIHFRMTFAFTTPRRFNRRTGDRTMRDVILTDRGPKPIGPYSQAIRANGFLYVSGQVALDPKTGEMAGAEIRQQTERTMENVKGILEAARSTVQVARLPKDALVEIEVIAGL